MLDSGTPQRTTYGELHPYRNQYFPGPRQWNQDASLYKQFLIREGMALRFNFDAFNVTNHPNNNAPGSSADHDYAKPAQRGPAVAARGSVNVVG